RPPKWSAWPWVISTRDSLRGSTSNRRSAARSLGPELGVPVSTRKLLLPFTRKAETYPSGIGITDGCMRAILHQLDSGVPSAPRAETGGSDCPAGRASDKPVVQDQGPRGLGLWRFPFHGRVRGRG